MATAPVRRRRSAREGEARSRAEQKASSHTLEDGAPVHSFQSLLEEFAAIVRNTCRAKGAPPDSATFELVTTPNATQRRAIDLLEALAV